MPSFEKYIRHLRSIHDTRRGTPELSYRAALENLLNDVGQKLRPKVFATAELADAGAGHPDFGLFEAKSGNLRAVVEVKALAEDTPETADGRQVAKYWNRYGCVLVTNYRDFLLVTRDAAGSPKVENRYCLAATEQEFWRANPDRLAEQHAEGLTDFLLSAMTRSAPILRPKDLADDLARHARAASRRLAHHDITALEPLQRAMEQTLGLHFAGADGVHFFRSSLIQTLFYGLFSGWMLWRQSKHAPGTYDWKSASEYLALPLVGDLYEEIAKPRRLANLGLREPLDWATDSLNRVDETEFFRTFDADHAITLFYEPFLEAFDPKLRKQFGVWYTPPEIVRYMVTRVDQLLRAELGIEDGLADDRVHILDPATGTGSYVVEIAKQIHARLTEQGHGAAAAAKVKAALSTRVYGFEILPAPYVIAHLQLGILLRAFGAPLAGEERAEVYLTNALTGWEPAREPKTSLLFPELQREAERAGRVKQEAPILVIIGNPPYDRFAGVAEDEEADLIEPYKAGLYETWGVRKQLLDDLYVRFFRLAEKRIADVGGRGIVSYISNYRWLDGISHPVMRERIATGFDEIWIDNCNGDKYKTGKRTPDGRPDESMFTTDEHRVGIQIGTAVATLVRRGTGGRKRTAQVHYREFWGTGNEKRAALLASLSQRGRGVPKYERFAPTARRRWVFVPGTGSASSYEQWPALPEIFPVHFSGLNENRQGALISDDPGELVRRIRAYLDPKVGDDEIAEMCPALMTDAARFDAKETRRTLLKMGEPFDQRYLVRLAYRPLDDAWVYWMPKTKLLNEKRAEFFEQVWDGNVFLSASQTARKGGFNTPFVVDKLGDLHLQDPWSQFFPLYVRTRDLLGERTEPNVAHALLESLSAALGSKPFGPDGVAWSKDACAAAEMLFYHAVAVVWAPAYRAEHLASLQQNWPRIPVPADRALLKNSATLGRTVADLLMPDRRIPGVTVGTLRPELRSIGVPSKVGGGVIDPATDLKVDAGWGFFGQRQAVMCGRGRVEPAAVDPGRAVDVYINDVVYWANVPLNVWTMTIGGFPVVKKWLSYREYDVLGRPLRTEEVVYVTEMVRRLRAALLLGDDLDTNYRAVCTAQLVSVRTVTGTSST